MLVLLLIKHSIELKRHLQNKVLRHSIELQYGHMTDIEISHHRRKEAKGDCEQLPMGKRHVKAM